MRNTLHAVAAKAHNLFTVGIGTCDASRLPHAERLVVVASTSVTYPTVLLVLPMHPPSEHVQPHVSSLVHGTRINVKPTSIRL